MCPLRVSLVSICQPAQVYVPVIRHGRSKSYLIGGSDTSRFRKHQQFLFGSCLTGFVGFHLSACSSVCIYVCTSYCNSHWTRRVVLKVPGSLAYRECDMTSSAPLTCAEAIRKRAAVIRQPREWWGFAEWLAWGWARKTRVKMLLV